MSETLADRIRQRLRETGQTANAASIRATNSPSAIPNILNGRSVNPRRDTLKKIADALETTVEWLDNGGVEISPKSEIRLAPDVSPPDMNAPKIVPVRGTAMGSIIHDNGATGFEGFVIDSDPVQYARMPDGLKVSAMSMEYLCRAIRWIRCIRQATWFLCNHIARQLQATL